MKRRLLSLFCVVMILVTSFYLVFAAQSSAKSTSKVQTEVLAGGKFLLIKPQFDKI
ncbi:hypothetical protein [Caldicellulosiruptor acetigenus]|uniref:hypothetical protein n=1 Tax=Caldicellulosiruptor acetigenus TaxID=301953 RepID=UPI000401B246|nr:hypothetical protein [Caldicellulosiruptor acetigenus]WAM35259.1 hypothetical protein OTK01_001585 [Caldicellulosiruptor acetigenus]